MAVALLCRSVTAGRNLLLFEGCAIDRGEGSRVTGGRSLFAFLPGVCWESLRLLLSTIGVSPWAGRRGPRWGRVQGDCAVRVSYRRTKAAHNLYPVYDALSVKCVLLLHLMFNER